MKERYEMHTRKSLLLFNRVKTEQNLDDQSFKQQLSALQDRIKSGTNIFLQKEKFLIFR